MTEFHADGGGHKLGNALDALDGALDLSTPNAARLVVIVSDGKYSTDQRRDAQTRLDRLLATGCAVLWLTVNDDDTPLDGATVHRLKKPTGTDRMPRLARHRCRREPAPIWLTPRPSRPPRPGPARGPGSTRRRCQAVARLGSFHPERGKWQV